MNTKRFPILRKRKIVRIVETRHNHKFSVRLHSLSEHDWMIVGSSFLLRCLFICSNILSPTSNFYLIDSCGIHESYEHLLTVIRERACECVSVWIVNIFSHLSGQADYNSLLAFVNCHEKEALSCFGQLFFMKPINETAVSQSSCGFKYFESHW